MLLNYKDVDTNVCASQLGAARAVLALTPTCTAVVSAECTKQIAKSAPNHSDEEAKTNERILVLAELRLRLGPQVAAFVVESKMCGEYFFL